MEVLGQIQQSGAFAYPFLCKVKPDGEEGENSYFAQIGRIFASPCFVVNSMQAFFDSVSKRAADLSSAKSPLLLTCRGLTLTVWQPDNRPGIYDSGKHAEVGTSLTYKGVTQVVSYGATDPQEAAQRRTAARAKRAKVRTAKIKALQKALAAAEADNSEDGDQ